MSSKPNILLFVCDDLRFDGLACMGDAIVQTPNLDRFATEGVCFERCYMPGGSSGAVCMPSRAMIHTGRSLYHIEGEGQTISEAHTTLGEHLGRAGYRTFHTGKWHNCRGSMARGFAEGDEIFFGGMDDQWNMPLYRFDPSGRYDARIPFVKEPFHEKTIQYRNGDHTSDGRHATDVFVDAARGFVESYDSEDPFFLSIALTSPHDPRTAPQEFHDLYDPEQIPLPANFLAQHPHDTGALPVITREGGPPSARDERLAGMPRRPNEIREHIADYYAMTSHLDHGFGRLREVLESSGQWENTIVVFTADHGLAVGRHGLMGKQCIYDHSVRVPLLMAGPGIPVGQRPEAMILHYGLFRTLCELVGLETPNTVEGESIKEIWEGSAGLDSIHLSYERTIRGLVEDDFKLIEYAGEEGYRATQLFNLAEDPDETIDLVRSPDHQGRITSMRQKVIANSHTSGDRESNTGRIYWRNFDQ